MRKQNLRIMVASEYPETRDFLRGLAAEEEGIFLVGQAPDGDRAVTLASNLRPDIAIIDSNLPHFCGLDTVRLSRMGGLDTAQAICETVPDTRVVIITNLDTDVLTESALGNAAPSLTRERIGGSSTIKLKDLEELMREEAPVFAHIQMRASAVVETSELNESKAFVGVWCIGAGLYLIGTIWLAPYGALLSIFGVGALTFHAAKRLIARLWRSNGS